MKRLKLLFFLLFSVASLSTWATTYYSKAAGNLNAVATWGTNTNGTGASPANFTTAGNIFIIVNNAAPTISANWTVSGAGSSVQVGDGTQAISFSVPSPRTFNAAVNVMATSTLTAVSGSTITGTIGVANTAFLIIQSATNPTLGTLATGSTVIYSRAGAQTIVNAAYDNLTLGGSGTKTLANTANTSVANVLTIGTGFAFQLNTNNLYTLTLNGTLTGAGTITGGANSNLTIGGTGAFGTIIPTASPLTIRTFIVNRAALGTITLGGNVTVSTTGTLTNGVLVLNGKTLTLNGTLTLPASAANGTITGSSTSNLSIGATIISNNLNFTTGAQTLRNFTLNSSGQTLNLGSNLTVSGAYTHTRGIVNLNGKTLTLSGTATFASTVANGTTSGSATSNLLVNTTAVTNRLFMTVGAQTLNNFTIGCTSGVTLRLGTSLTVSGAFTHNSGTLYITGVTLTINGTSATFPVASTNGTLRGSNSANLSISAASLSNTLFFTTGSQLLRNFTLNSPSQTLTIGTTFTVGTTFTHTSGIINLNGKTLTVSGATTFPTSVANGSFTGSTASALSFSGVISAGSLFMTQTSAATRALSTLKFNRNANTLTLGNQLDIYDSIMPTLGTIASGGNLNLIADQTTVGKAGRIAIVGGSITGNIVSQVYHAPNTNNTDWRNLGVAGVTGAGFSQWANIFPVTCPTCPMTQAGGVAFSSITTYAEPTETYPDITYSANMAPGTGYWVYLGSSSPGTASSAYLISVTGTAKTGPVSVAITNSSAGTMNGYNLVANPYASPISFTKLQTNNAARISNAWYTYSPGYGDNAAYVGGLSTPSYSHGGTGIDATIPAGMGFFVHATAAGNLNFIENLKVTGSNEVLLRENNSSTSTQSGLTYFRMQVSNGANMMNEAVVRFDANGTTGFDYDYDLFDLSPGTPGWLQISTYSGGPALTVNTLPDLTQNYSIPVSITCSTTSTYQFSATDLQNIPSGACMILHDNYTGSDYDIRNGAFNLAITDTEKVARFVLNVTINNSLVVNGTPINPSCSASTNGSIIASASGNGPWNYYWKDSVNNIIKTSLNKTTADTLTGISNGYFSLDVNTVGTCDNGTQSFTLQGTSVISPSFSPSSTSVIWVQDTVSVSFTNTSNNANTYLWNFGNSNTSTDTNAVNYYDAPGDYVVTLTAYNAACGDSAVYTQTITVIDGTLNGIASVAEPSKNMFISRDELGYYVQFHSMENTNAVISVQNMLGENITDNLSEKNISNIKVYIPLGNPENQILIISVVTENGGKTYCKIIY